MLFDTDFKIISYEVSRYAKHLKKISLLPAPEGIPPTVILLSFKAKSNLHTVA